MEENQNLINNIIKNEIEIPDDFSWYTIDIFNKNDLENVYILLRDNYTHDELNRFRFHYSKEQIQWYCSSPNYYRDWLLGLKFQDKLVGFICAIPKLIQVYDKQLKIAEINFLCLDNLSRSYGFTTKIIEEIKRRIKIREYKIGCFGSSEKQNESISYTSYYHRYINIKKLLDLEFISLETKMSFKLMERFYKINEKLYYNWIPFERKHISLVYKFINNYLKENCHFYSIMNEKDIEHWLLPKSFLFTWIKLDNENQKVTDLISFYTIESSILNNKNTKHKQLTTGYSIYLCNTTIEISKAINDLLIFSKQKNCDLHNCLDILNYNLNLKECKFKGGNSLLYFNLNGHKTDPIKNDKLSYFIF